MRRSAAFCIILLGLSGCETTVASVALAVVGSNVMSLTYTDKTLVDFAAGAASGRDCSVLNIEEKRQYCQERVERNGAVATLYCYPTLGRPECYEDPLPDRHRTGTQFTVPAT